MALQTFIPGVAWQVATLCSLFLLWAWVVCVKQIKFIRYTRSQKTNRKLENKNIKKQKHETNGVTRTQRQTEACTNMGPKNRLDNTVKLHSQHKNHRNWRLLILDLKLLTDGDSTMLSSKAFQILITRLEKKLPSRAECTWVLASFVLLPLVRSMHERKKSRHN